MSLALIGLGLALGLRHGIDWDHIAAITDITGSVVTTDEQAAAVIADSAAGVITAAGPGTALGATVHSTKFGEARDGIYLATLYALGHAAVVIILGLLAIWAGTILPPWIDPVMERLVGVTLLVLGAWIFYSIWRYGRSFRLRSRWMLVFALAGRCWDRVHAAVRGHHHEHAHPTPADAQYGPKTAFGIGLIHGIGAETGSQALLLAGAAGATSPQTGTVMLLAFVLGLVVSNSLIALFSTLGLCRPAPSGTSIWSSASSPESSACWSVLFLSSGAVQTCPIYSRCLMPSSEQSGDHAYAARRTPWKRGSSGDTAKHRVQCSWSMLAVCRGGMCPVVVVRAARTW